MKPCKPLQILRVHVRLQSVVTMLTCTCTCTCTCMHKVCVHVHVYIHSTYTSWRALNRIAETTCKDILPKATCTCTCTCTCWLCTCICTVCVIYTCTHKYRMLPLLQHACTTVKYSFQPHMYMYMYMTAHTE